MKSLQADAESKLGACEKQVTGWLPRKTQTRVAMRVSRVCACFRLPTTSLPAAHAGMLLVAIISLTPAASHTCCPQVLAFKERASALKQELENERQRAVKVGMPGWDENEALL